jgi:two-component system cell cycle sensor histidine kinase/response regulator CckA
MSTPGQGSRFEVLLPCTCQPADETHNILESDSASASLGGPVRVLLVEDEEELRTAVSKMLRRKGLAVFEAKDGRAGVDLFQMHAEEIDVVLLDLTLPGMTGREVLEELRRLRRDVKVVITSAYGREVALKALGGPESWLYIRKPYQALELVEMLRDVCQAGPHVADLMGNPRDVNSTSA